MKKAPWKSNLLRNVGRSVKNVISETFAFEKTNNSSVLRLDNTEKMEAISRLTAGVAHDFNNLLTVVLGNAAALRVSAETRGDADGVRRAELIERVSERGGRLAGQLLSFSRNQMLKPEIISVYQVISKMHEILGQAAGDSIRVSLLSEHNLWNCHVDPSQLESAILNLVLNARDAITSGGKIEISCHNQSGSGLKSKPSIDTVRIDVKDTGSGIPSELIDKVFEPFFTTKTFGQGSGLGLAQVHGFVGQSGGWVELHSIVDVGTTVSLFLPKAGKCLTAPVLEAGTSTLTGNKQTILIVEPNLALRETVFEILTQAGYHCISVADAAGALTHLVSNIHIDVILTEAILPNSVRGVDLVSSVRQTRPNLRALVTSGSPVKAAKALQDVDAIYDFLKKPYQADDLVRVIGALLKAGTFSVETERMIAEVRDTEFVLPISPVSSINHDDSAIIQTSCLPRVETTTKRATIRIGVMPFKTVRSTNEHAFSIGLADEITKTFSCFRSITCVEPSSIAALAGESPSNTNRWQELDLDFLLDGSLRRKGNEIGVLVRLINMRGSGEITWRKRFGGNMPNMLNLQDQIAAETAAQLGPEILVWEGREAALRPQVDPTAYDLMLRAIPATYCLDQAGFKEAGNMLERSLELDPNSAACRSWLAHWHQYSVGQGWENDPATSIRKADQLTQEAIRLDPKDARAYTVAGHVRAFLNKDSHAALTFHERAIELNPNLALAWCYSGLAHTYLGQHTEAIRRMEHAQRLSPYDPHGFMFEMALTLSFLLSNRFEEAVCVGRKAYEKHAGFTSTLKSLSSALGHLGARKEASTLLKELLILEPNFSLQAARDRSPLKREEDLDCYIKGLRLAGLT